MTKIVLGLISLLVAPLVGTSAFAQNGRNDDDRAEAIKYGWAFDYTKAIREARATNRPLMVVFRCVP